MNFKHIATVATVATLVTFCIFPIATASAETPAPQTKGYQRTLLKLQISGLNNEALYYQSNAKGKRPLLIFLHGRGGGNKPIGNKISPAANGFSKQNLVCDVIHPYTPDGWQAQSLDQLIDHLLANFPIDSTRLYVAGSSMGGAGTWKYGFEGKHNIAAFAPIASGASKLGKVHDKWNLEDMKSKPIWMFHGDKDTVVPYANAKETADKMAAINPQFKFTTYPGVAHGSAKPAMLEKELFQWFLRHSTK